MAQVADYVIANASGANVRSDLIAVFAAIQSCNAGSQNNLGTTAKCQLFADTQNDKLKIRSTGGEDAGASATFFEIGDLDQTNLGLLKKSGGAGTEMTGQFLALASTNPAVPSVCFAGDTDTGFYRLAENVIGVATAGSQRLFINQDGDIALGTDTVRNGAKLNVKNDTQVVATFECQNADPQIYIGDNMASTDNNTLVIGYDRQDNRGYLTIAADSDVAGINIGNTGSVGIGAASNADKLEVFGAIRSKTSSSNFNAGDESSILDFVGSSHGRVGTVAGASGTARAFAFVIGGVEKARFSPTGTFFLNKADTSDTAAAMVVDGGDLKHRVEAGETRRIYFLQGSGAYSLPSSGGAAIGSSVVAESGGHSQDIFFETHKQGVGAAERLRIASDGTVTISTADVKITSNSANEGSNLEITNTTSNPAGIHLKSGHGNFAIYNSRLNANCLEFMDDGATKMMLKPVTNTAGTQHDLQLPNSAGTLVNYFTGFHTSSTSIQVPNGNRAGIHFDGSTMYLHAPSASSAFEVWTKAYNASGVELGELQLRISQQGDITNRFNSYGVLSDEKLKQDIVDSGSQWNDIKAVKLKKFKFKSEVANVGSEKAQIHLGVIAQDLEDAGMSGLVNDNPDIIDGKDQGTVTKSVKASILYMKAVKALQESMERIETLETKVAALESA